MIRQSRQLSGNDILAVESNLASDGLHAVIRLSDKAKREYVAGKSTNAIYVVLDWGDMRVETYAQAVFSDKHTPAFGKLRLSGRETSVIGHAIMQHIIQRAQNTADEMATDISQKVICIDDLADYLLQDTPHTGKERWRCVKWLTEYQAANDMTLNELIALCDTDQTAVLEEILK